MFRHSLLAATACAALAGGAAHATVAIDQNAPVNNSLMAVFGQPDLAQSFTAGQANSAGAGIFLHPRRGSGTTTITIGLWADLPNIPGAQLLASGTDSTSSPGTWFDVFWAPVAVTPGASYFLVFTSTSPDFGIAGDISNGYAGGNTFANGGFFPFFNFDYTFRTYYSTSVAAVPAPGAALLLGAGLLGLAAVRRHR